MDGPPMPFARLFRHNARREAAYRLYAELVAQARQPFFFEQLGVPDTLDGRFELIALHAMLVFHRLQRDHAATRAFAQELFDAMFADLDRALREMGTGDLGVGRQVKRMAAAFYGRVRSYERGLAGSHGPLADNLRRNLFGTVAAPSAAALATMAAYMHGTLDCLGGQSTEALLGGSVRFPDPAGFLRQVDQTPAAS
jgi:cytochrome b pre-mRNA-processing protein 3